jgi:hypothetical protein
MAGSMIGLVSVMWLQCCHIESEIISGMAIARG